MSLSSRTVALCFMFLACAPGIARAETFYVYICTPGKAVGSEVGGALGSLASLFGMASKEATDGAATKVVAGFAEKGITATVTSRKEEVSALPCSILDGGGAVTSITLPAGTYWMLSVNTEGASGWGAEALGLAAPGLLRKFAEKDVVAAVCEKKVDYLNVLMAPN